MKENNPRTVESYQEYGEKIRSLSSGQRKTIAMGLVMAALSGPIATDALAESKYVSVGLEAEYPLPGQDSRPVTNQERYDVQKMIMSFNKVDIMDLPYDTIRRMIVEEDNKKFEVYRQELRELGRNNEVVISEVVINKCAQWKYAVDHFENGPMKDSNRLGTYVTHEQINQYALTGEGLNVYEEEGVPYFLMASTTEKTDKAFRDTINWYKENGAENVVQELSDRGFCVLFPFVFYKNTGFGTASFDYNTGVINPNGNVNEVKKYREDAIVDNMLGVLNNESAGIIHGRVMQAITSDKKILDAFKLEPKHLEIVKSFMMFLNFDFLYKKTGSKIYLDNTEDYLQGAYQYAKEFATTINEDFTIRQLEMMTIGGLTNPLGTDSWDFAREKIEEIKKSN